MILYLFLVTSAISEELSRSPRPHALTDSPSFSFSSLNFSDDDENIQPVADHRRSSSNHAARLERPVSQVSINLKLIQTFFKFKFYLSLIDLFTTCTQYSTIHDSTAFTHVTGSRLFAAS
jgi:hypothetical protein